MQKVLGGVVHAGFCQGSFTGGLEQRGGAERVEAILDEFVERMPTVSAPDIDGENTASTDIQQCHVRLVVEAPRRGWRGAADAGEDSVASGPPRRYQRGTFAAIVYVEPPYLSAHVADEELVRQFVGVRNQGSSLVLLDIDHPHAAGDAELHLLQRLVMPLAVAGGPELFPGPGIDDIDGVADVIFRIHAGGNVEIILVLVVSAAEDQYVPDGVAYPDPGLDRSGPCLAQLLEAGGSAAEYLPQHARRTAIGDIQRIDIAPTPTHGGIGVDELVGVQAGRGVGAGIAIDDAVVVGIVHPDSHGVVHAIQAWFVRSGFCVVPELPDVPQQGLGHEGELLRTVIGVEGMDEAFIGTEEGAQVRVCALSVGEGVAAIGNQAWRRVDRVAESLAVPLVAAFVSIHPADVFDQGGALDRGHGAVAKSGSGNVVIAYQILQRRGGACR
ncbi:hypothetical protein D9M70_373440 [compost metagenome]